MQRNRNEVLKKINLLYVEDEEITREQVSKILKPKCNKFFIAENGVEGFELYKQYKPDIVLTDISMPKMGGLEMTKLIQEIDKDVVVIITTAHNETSFLINSIENGVKSYVIKPIDPILLLNTISKNSENILMKKELKKKDKVMLQQALLSAKADLLHDIAHHWRQPLSLISLLVEITLNDFQDSKLTLEELQKNVDIITKTVNNLSTTINIFTSNYKSISKNFNLKEAIETILFITEAIYKPLNVKIDYFNLDDYYINGDKNLFFQIINHIMVNSVEAHNKNKTKNPYIKISLEDNFIVIEDNAGGVKNDVTIEEMLQPYFSTKEDLNGKGLGLFVSNFLMEQEFKGEIELNNINYGFQVSLIFPKDILFKKENL